MVKKLGRQCIRKRPGGSKLKKVNVSEISVVIRSQKRKNTFPTRLDKGDQASG